MRTIIAGSRTCTDFRHVEHAMRQCGWTPTVVLSGMARGVDKLGEKWAKENGIKIEYYQAAWDTQGKRAGYIRNERMAKNADALVAVWDGASKGTKHMIDLANKLGLKVFCWRI